MKITSELIKRASDLEHPGGPRLLDVVPQPWTVSGFQRGNRPASNGRLGSCSGLHPEQAMLVPKPRSLSFAGWVEVVHVRDPGALLSLRNAAQKGRRQINKEIMLVPKSFPHFLTSWVCLEGCIHFCFLGTRRVIIMQV